MAADPSRPDHEVLGFAAEHRLVLETQLTALLGSEPIARSVLRALVKAEQMTRRRLFAGHPAYCQIRRGGLAAIGCELPVPRLKLAEYKHDIGLAWLWLAARRGSFGAVAEVLGERRMRSHDGAVRRRSEPYGVRLGGSDARGNARLHYPDLVLIDDHGHRLALELELTPKDRDRRDRILDAYGADARVSAVLYLTEDHRVGRSIARGIDASARRAGLGELIHVQLVEPIDGPATFDASRPARAAQRSGRSPGRASSGRTEVER